MGAATAGGCAVMMTTRVQMNQRSNRAPRVPTLPQSAATHAAYERILVLFVPAPSVGEVRLRAGAIARLIADEKTARTLARLSNLERLGCLRRVEDGRPDQGGRLYALGATSLPPFDDGNARVVYEHARGCYAALAAAGKAGLTSGALRALCGDDRVEATCNRLTAWESRGKVACDRSAWPYRWVALLPELPDYDAMVAAEDARRRAQKAPRGGGPVRNWVVGLVPPKPRLQRLLDGLPRSPMMGA